MCGIVGYIGDRPDEHIHGLMGTLQHRGPDDSGCYINKRLAFGFQRLAILDLSLNGHQPMFSDNGNYVIIFNGEIYNYQEIKKELLNEGVFFNSESDTETLVNGYQVWGEEVLNKLNGIFAFAIYDIRADEIFIARDQFGVKPLYYYQDEEVFLFGSEIKSFLRIPSFDRSIDEKGLLNYINYLWSPGATTAFKKVKKLLPGHFLKFSINSSVKNKIVKYYDIPFNGTYLNLPEEDIINQLEEKLLSAVKRQLMSDVPVGFFLSGGLDSSLLVAMARRLNPDQSIQSFTINTSVLAKNEGFSNDLDYARLVASHLNVSLEIVDANIDIVNDFDKMIWHLDEPQADFAPLNVLNICKRSKEMGYKVLIGGAGGDDLFSGYRRHIAINYEKYFSIIPNWGRKFLKHISNELPSNNSTCRRIRKLMIDLDKTTIERQTGYFSWIPLSVSKTLFSPQFQKLIGGYNPLDYLTSLVSNIPTERNDLNQMLYWEMKSFLVDHNLNYTDKLSMAVGVEARVPYLDIELVEFSTKIHPELKLKGKETKYILKKVAERYLPKEVIYRSKAGFGAPVRGWITYKLEDKINTYLSKSAINKRGIFNADAVWKLIEYNNKNKIDASYVVLTLLAIESWMRQFVDKSN